jgi:Flp pilus assembly protein TadG
MSRLGACLRRFARDRRGGPAIEFALTAPVLALLILGIVAVGFEVDARIDAREAVRAGAHAVMAGEEDANAIRLVVLNALGSASDAYTVQVTEQYRCGATLVSAEDECGGDSPQRYFVIAIDAAAGAAYVDAPAISASIEVRVA